MITSDRQVGGITRCKVCKVRFLSGWTKCNCKDEPPKPKFMGIERAVEIPKVDNEPIKEF